MFIAALEAAYLPQNFSLSGGFYFGFNLICILLTAARPKQLNWIRADALCLAFVCDSAPDPLKIGQLLPDKRFCRCTFRSTQ